MPVESLSSVQQPSLSDIKTGGGRVKMSIYNISSEKASKVLVSGLIGTWVSHL